MIPDSIVGEENIPADVLYFQRVCVMLGEIEAE